MGRIVESHVSEECLVDGRPDPVKVNPFLFAGFGYYTIGEYIGDAFRCGIDINSKAKLDTLDELKRMSEEREKR